MIKRIFRILFVSILCLTMLLTTACRKNPSSEGSSLLSESYIENTYDDSSELVSNVSSDQSVPNDTTSNVSGNNSSQSSESTSGKDTTVIDLKGRTITFVANWEELKKGSSQRANIYWERKEAIEKKYNCKIVHKFMSKESIDTEIIPSILSGKPIADFFYTEPNRVYSLVNKGLLYPLSDLKQFDFSEEKWSSVVIDANTYEGKVYGCDSNNEPWITGALLYNKDYFQKNNLPDLNELQKSGGLTWDKFREIAKNATKGDVKGFAMNASHEFTLPIFIHANDGAIVTRTGDYSFSSTVNSKNTINAMQFWQDMCIVDKSVATESNSYLGFEDAFTSGKAAIHYAESYRWPDIVNNSNFEVGLALMPAGPDSSQNYGLSFGMSACVMPQNVKNPEEVALVIDAFNGADKMPWEDYMYDIFYDDDIMDTLKIAIDEVNKGNYKLDYIDTIGDVYDLGLHGAYGQIGSGQATPAQAVESINGIVKSAIDSLG